MNIGIGILRKDVKRKPVKQGDIARGPKTDQEIGVNRVSAGERKVSVPRPIDQKGPVIPVAVLVMIFYGRTVEPRMIESCFIQWHEPGGMAQMFGDGKGVVGEQVVFKRRPVKSRVSPVLAC